jgi:hypothetical protein
MSPIQQFGDVARRLAYNPLGIIALFIVLCYAIACSLFGLEAQHLQPNERWPLVWFVVGFPVVVLFVFTWLVAKHHTKLYAPKDFPDSSTYLRTLGIEEQKRKLDEEVAEAIAQAPAKTDPSRWPAEQSVRISYVIAEDLVMRELQSEFGVTINRQVSFGPQDHGFDGMFVKDGEAFIVDVKLSMSSQISERVWSTLTQMRNYVVHSHWKRVRCVLAVVVVDVQQKAALEQAYASEIQAKYPGFVLLRVYVYDDLAKKYGVEDKTG